MSVDHGSSILHVSLDLKTAFDTIDHANFLNKLQTSCVISGTIWHGFAVDFLPAANLSIFTL